LIHFRHLRLSEEIAMNRRDFVRISGCSALGVSVSGWLSRLAAETVNHPDRRRSCILMWMAGDQRR
jgi:hypothetical protein